MHIIIQLHISFATAVPNRITSSPFLQTLSSLFLEFLWDHLAHTVVSEGTCKVVLKIQVGLQLHFTLLDHQLLQLLNLLIFSSDLFII